MTYTNAAILGNKWSELKCKTLDVDALAATETCSHLRGGRNGEPLEQAYFFFRTGGKYGKVGGRTLIPVAEKRDA